MPKYYGPVSAVSNTRNEKMECESLEARAKRLAESANRLQDGKNACLYLLKAGHHDEHNECLALHQMLGRITFRLLNVEEEFQQVADKLEEDLPKKKKKR